MQVGQSCGALTNPKTPNRASAQVLGLVLACGCYLATSFTPPRSQGSRARFVLGKACPQN